jgi:hypothetical protein
MATTYEAIATVEVGSGGAATIDFTSIPQTYTDLVLKISKRDTRNTGDANPIKITFNGNTSSYTYKMLYGDGSSVSSYSESSFFTDAGWGGYGNQNTGNTANTFSNHEIYIPNYAGSNNKSFSVDSVHENNATNAYAQLVANLWSNTAAITSITLTPNNGFNFVQYSTATLYGIKNS